MKTSYKNPVEPIFREGALGMKEFYKLSKKDKDAYVLSLMNIPESERGMVDRHLITFHQLEVKPINFFSIEG
jgi:hypothetical protein